MNWDVAYSDARVALPYVFMIVAAVILHHLFSDSFIKFLRLFVDEIKDFAKLKPTLGSLNFLGILAATAIVTIFIAMDLLHVSEILPSVNMDGDAKTLYKSGISATVILFYFLFILLSITVSRSDRHR